MNSKITDLQIEKWDVIIIGSGVGGLTLGALLSKYRKKNVLILEKYTKIGGYAHTFSRRNNYKFDVGLHHLGGLDPGSQLRKTLDHLTSGKLEWKSFPYIMDKIYYSDISEEVHIPSNMDDYITSLKKKFPEDSDALDSYYPLLQKYARAYYNWSFSEIYPKIITQLVRKYLRLRYPLLFSKAIDVLSKKFKSKDLISRLMIYWIPIGEPPEVYGFGIHAISNIHFCNGMWYPKGGAENFITNLSQVILQNNGKIITNAHVEEILIERDKAIGVRLKDQSILKAKKVVSCAGASSTYGELIKNKPINFAEDLKKNPVSLNYCALYMGLKESPHKLNIDTANHWLLKNPDYGSCLNNENLSSVRAIYLSSPSLKRDSDRHTLEALALVDSHFFRQWEKSKWRKRPQDYEDFKNVIKSDFLDFIEKYRPGIRDSLLFSEVSTPLSTKHFITGNYYSLGISERPEKSLQPWVKSRSPIKNLYLTGADTFSWGVIGAVTSGMKTYQILSKSPWSQFFSKIRF